MAKKMKRILAICMALVLCISVIATPAMATGTVDSELGIPAPEINEIPAEQPAGEAPAEEPAAEEIPVEEPVVEEIPAEEPAAEEIPAEEIPAEEIPAEEPAAEEIPVVKIPVEESKEGKNSKAPNWGWGGGWGNYDDQYEWYQVYVQGNLVASGQGKGGDMYYLGTHYTAGITANGPIVSWFINTHGGTGNKFSGTADLRNYITIPEGFTVKDYEIAESSVDGVNSAAGSAYFDNAIIKITIKTIYNEDTGEEIEIPTEPDPVATKVTVNHIYKTYDDYTKQTTEDGRTSSTADATEGDSYTAVPVAEYNGNTYARRTGDDALTITIKADAAQNVITIEYLREIDTTPIPVATKVTVNHIYNTYDAYTKLTTEDGRTSSTADVTEGDSYTASAVLTYGGNEYAQTSVDPAMTITIAADAAANVINITYLRSIDTTPVNYTPVVEIVKTADKAVYENGETITWTITVKNTGAHAAYNVVVVDELTGDTWNIAELAAGAEKTYTAVTENAASGSVKNVVVASWDDNDEIPDEEEPNEVKTSSDEETVNVNDPIPENYTPVLSVVKTAEKDTYKEGEAITFTITVKNTSEYTAYNVVVVDELAKGYWTIDALEGGAEKSFTVTMENVAAGSVKNVAVVSWDDNDEIPDEEEPNEIKETKDEEIVTVEELIDYAPVVSISKSASKNTYKKGATIKWTITVKNISDYTAYNVVVVDELTGDSWSIAALEPGAQRTFTARTRNAQVGKITNVVVVAWDDNDEIDDTEEPEEVKLATAEDTVKVEKPKPIIPPAQDDPEETKPEENKPEGETPVVVNEEIEIPDEEVPLADAPKTGDISALWIALSSASAAGMILLGKKREDEEE